MELKGLITERRNRASADLDNLSALEIATLMNRQDAKVLRAVRLVLPWQLPATPGAQRAEPWHPGDS